MINEIIFVADWASFPNKPGQAFLWDGAGFGGNYWRVVDAHPEATLEIENLRRRVEDLESENEGLRQELIRALK